MQFSTSDLPSGIDSVEKLVAWGVQVLAAAQYPPLELSNNSGPVAPAFEQLSRAPSGPNYGKPYLEFGGYLELDNSLYPTDSAYLAAVPFDAAAVVPERFKS